MTDQSLPLPLLMGLLFTLMGPIAVIPLFATVTAGADAASRRKIAFVAFATSNIALAIGVLIGASAMAKVGTSRSSLIIAAGVILLLTALRSIFGVAASSGAPPDQQPAGAAIGFAPIAIPGIVTPTGVAVLIIFASYFPSTEDTIAIILAVLFVMTLNGFAMLGASWFMRTIGLAPLVVLGAVFGVLQAAMGIEMIMSGIARSRLLMPG